MALLEGQSSPSQVGGRRLHSMGFLQRSSLCLFCSLALLARGAGGQDCAVYFVSQLTEKYSLASLQPARDQT